MSAPGKFDYSSGGLDRSLYRSNFSGQMERSGSFRESVEHSVPSHPIMLRSTLPLAQTDVTNFFQCLRFDPKVVAADHKSIRQSDFKRHVNIALGIQGDESPNGSFKGKLIPSPIPEEIKRLKAGLRENNVKARERVKIFNEASSVFNKFFPSVPTKKRSRAEGFSGDRSGDRLVSGVGLSKMGFQGQNLAGGFELDQQKLDERPKINVPNKRTRTSMMDVRSNSIVRQPSAVDRDKEMMRLANHNAVQGEDRTSIGIDGWEKSKMKKKRSSINADCHPNLASNKVVDGYRDLKQGIQQKSMGDTRSRSNCDSNMLRQAAGNGATGYGRSDSFSHQTSLAGHSSLPRVDSDHRPLYNEKRERPICSDKERVNLRAINKSSNHDDFNSSSLVANTKGNASVRGPRSGSGLPPKLSPGFHNTPSPSDWDVSGCTNKPPTLPGATHRKRMTSNRSSSPPVTQWASQRPQKISRIARRTNIVPIVSSKDDVPYSDYISDAGCSETGFGFHKRSPAVSPQLKLKGESSFSTAALSESEESGPTEIKSKDKGIESDEVDGRAEQSIPKVSFPALHSRKSNKLAGEEIGGGVKRQGRTGRGFSSTRSLNPMGVEKLKNVGTAKHLRSARPNSEKIESKVGRPPTRKLSDRKAYKRQRATATNASTLDFHVGSDNGHEELLAAANSAVNFVQSFPNPFWKQMERYFCYISDDHINFMKQQGELSSMGLTPYLTSSDLDSRVFPEELATSRVDSKASPLYQRLLSALISEDSMIVNEDLQVDGFGTMHDLEDDSDFSVLNNMVESNGFRNNERLEYDESEDDGSAILFNGVNKSIHHCNGKFPDHSSIDFSDIQYDKLGIDEKIYLEAQSIGISLEAMPSISNVEDEGITEEIKNLEEVICKEGSKKKEIVDRLLTPTLEMKELREKELDQLGYDKLVEMAYEKTKASRRHHTAGGKNSINKISKQAAQSFVKRTLERCRQFEKTGKSCFSEPEIKDMFIARLARAEDIFMDKEYNLSTSTPMGSQPSSSLARIGQNSENYASSSDVLPSENALLEQTMGKEDTAWSNRVKKRELLLDDVGIGTQLSSSTKGKRSDRDRDGKGQASSRSGTNKIGRPSLSNYKGERKSKAKPKQKASHIPSSFRISEQPKAPLPKSSEANSEYNNLEALDETEPMLDLSQLQIPDGLGGPDDFDTQPGDIGSWLNMDEEEDFDISELGIPMDDLSGLNIKL